MDIKNFLKPGIIKIVIALIILLILIFTFPRFLTKEGDIWRETELTACPGGCPPGTLCDCIKIVWHKDVILKRSIEIFILLILSYLFSCVLFSCYKLLIVKKRPTT